MQFVKSTLVFAMMLAGLTACHDQDKNTKVIGIVLPLEHKAMQEIVKGFTETLKQQYHQPVKIVVENAEGDPNLERAILQKMHDNHYDVIVPVGTDATEMAVSMAEGRTVVSLASDLSDQARHQLKDCNVAVVHDEISVEQSLKFIHAVYPNIHELTLVHSAANKVFPEVQAAVAAGKAYGITIHPLMVSSLAELYSVANSIPATSQGIFVLKDSLIVSGIATLAKTASDKHIPLITSDEGSVESGAGFAMGVYESQIGVQGAELASAVLNGSKACDLPIREMRDLTVFVNQSAMQSEGQTLAPITQAATSFTYKIKMVGG